MSLTEIDRRATATQLGNVESEVKNHPVVSELMTKYGAKILRIDLEAKTEAETPEEEL